jgi:hypothetical protein
MLAIPRETCLTFFFFAILLVSFFTEIFGLKAQTG